ncbi:peroxiredoxin [Vannielia litorea]|uniref:Glutathione-dependent peroxiredoxin n=1 Tax=Vannielia litorea TaxID=1217970 RepID=A0A1N6H256_9RHOB|nr:peroxiredoxin [Vannielia litorea]SIO13874.1 cytochrome c peroxidase [Vannielia litorea]
MQISVGDTIPSATFVRMGAEGPEQIALKDITTGKKVIIFGLPGAYTGTCSTKHVPSYIENMDMLKDKGVAEVICVSVNDPFVMDAWGKDTGAAQAGIHMLADPEGTFTKEIGMTFNAPPAGLINRSLRYAMVLHDNVVTTFNLEGGPGECSVSAAPALFDEL